MMKVLNNMSLRFSLSSEEGFLALAARLGRSTEELLGPVERYGVTGMRSETAGGVDAALSAAARLSSDKQWTVQYFLPAPISTMCELDIRMPEGGWKILVQRWLTRDPQTPAPPTWYPAALELARRFLRTGDVQGLELEANRAYATWLPSPPIARNFSAVVTTRAEVEAAYDDPDAFWQTWEGVEWFGEQALVHRAMGAVYHEQWLQRVVPGNLALTRIAKPKLTHYGIARVHPWERVFYGAPARRLQAGGYHPQKHIALFTCWLGPNEHLCAADIATAGGLLEKGADADGRPIAEVHVQFGRHEMAVRERRPLLDRGVRVFYDDAVTGDTIELTA